MVTLMYCDYIVVHSEEHFPTSLQIEGNHEKGFDVLLYPELCSSLITGVDTSFGLPLIRMLQLNSLKCSS